jgi:acyl-CoA synthetase (NDP forming)
MNAKELIRKAKAEGRTALNEAESKSVLKEYGVPVVAESIAATPEEGASAADRWRSLRPQGRISKDT